MIEYRACRIEIRRDDAGYYFAIAINGEILNSETRFNSSVEAEQASRDWTNDLLQSNESN